ncbi:MAG: hypothetical protein ACREVJ_14180, partial [Gammaproteobacteria bacterium]
AFTQNQALSALVSDPTPSLREKVLRPILAGVGKPRMGRKPKTWSPIDEHYAAIRQNMFTAMDDLRIAA